MKLLGLGQLLPERGGALRNMSSSMHPGEHTGEIRFRVPSCLPRSTIVSAARRWKKLSIRKSRLTKANVESWEDDGVPVQSLSRNFRDAIEVARRLGFRFLWVDALCIITQGDAADWHEEAPPRCARSTDALRWWSRQLRRKIATRGFCMNAQHSRLPSSGDSGACSQPVLLLQHGPVRQRTRGANVEAVAHPQERAARQQRMDSAREGHGSSHPPLHGLRDDMGMRTVLRVRAGVGLEKRSRASGTNRGAKQTLSKKMWQDFRRGDAEVTNPGSSLHVHPPQPLLAWFNCIQEYSWRELTYAGDKLPAVAGLAGGIGARLGQYLAVGEGSSLTIEASFTAFVRESKEIDPSLAAFLNYNFFSVDTKEDYYHAGGGGGQRHLFFRIAQTGSWKLGIVSGYGHWFSRQLTTDSAAFRRVGMATISISHSSTGDPSFGERQYNFTRWERRAVKIV
ncbi:uncharacterized protein MKZ38_001768 [Zalerion maritima]|uniref:Heterokaryon incompatibility domain-containing protein n=1 Tax=Zalerion maritima TaxID=339359 RepID=A0AAD5RYZ6_9PEZI|nr:uncharacterized protein MKZ38_001768 [Zalerion maritima]